MKYKYTLPGIGAVVVIVILSLSALFLTEAKAAGQESPEQRVEKMAEVGEGTLGETDILNSDTKVVTDEETEVLPIFFVEDINTFQIENDFSLEDYYITSRYTAGNYFYVDEDGVLWGTGMNEYGQLGTGTYGMEEYYEEPIKIAEHVISVDASWNDYFCIYLTVSGELYGIGLNYAGLLLGKGSETNVYFYDQYQKVTEPVLLMENVAYARAGMECIVAIQTDRTAYWWGQYAPLTRTHVDGDYWKLEEDDRNPAKMFASEPKKILEHCKYITTGAYTGAAISEAGELYTWGFNIFGQCGMPVTEDDFVRTPVKIMDSVKMVWFERIVFNDPASRPSEFARWTANYNYNTFVLKEDNTLLAVGLDMGDKEKVTELNGDLVETRTYRYGDSFVPVRAVEYSADYNLKVLSELEFGMTLKEVDDVLGNAGLHTFDTDGNGIYCLSANYNQYHCYFDSEQKLYQILLQEGGSRDGRFMLGMSFSDLEEAVEEAGGSLAKSESDTASDIWIYQDQEQQIQYEFSVYEGRVYVLYETAMSESFNQ